MFGPVMPRQGSYFFLLAQEKANQKEGHPLHRSLREFPALLAMPGGCGTRAIRCAATRSDSPRRLPPAWLRYSAAQQGAPKTKSTPVKPEYFVKLS